MPHHSLAFQLDSPISCPTDLLWPLLTVSIKLTSKCWSPAVQQSLHRHLHILSVESPWQCHKVFFKEGMRFRNLWFDRKCWLICDCKTSGLLTTELSPFSWCIFPAQFHHRKFYACSRTRTNLPPPETFSLLFRDFALLGIHSTYWCFSTVHSVLSFTCISCMSVVFLQLDWKLLKESWIASQVYSMQCTE